MCRLLFSVFKKASVCQRALEILIKISNEGVFVGWAKKLSIQAPSLNTFYWKVTLSPVQQQQTPVSNLPGAFSIVFWLA